MPAAKKINKTIGFPPILYNRLRDKARANRRDLTKHILWVLEEHVGLPHDDPSPSRTDGK